MNFEGARIKENKVETSLTGEPRWWTVQTDKQTVEIVRVDFTPGPGIAFVILKPGHYAHPPLVTTMFRFGEAGLESIKEKGGQVFTYDTDLGRRLELLLVGFGR